ncbi:serine/threonine-protein kinase [Cellulomonas sp. PhB143]|uniref:serine/threonine-protein kinase n=1 Tax=Cellulomonas sp. PhB143 TaxID=2485186 RepID=UPI000F49492D|nr:serine/threonine-protein kinase [Cellulomonas sp. PhB143]ROS78785.1 protein kinase-like protein [Cellulomonas sp. PhB143]
MGSASSGSHGTSSDAPADPTAQVAAPGGARDDGSGGSPAAAGGPPGARVGTGLPPGTDVGGYTIVSRLGSGAMGTVYAARDGGGHACALKLLHAHVDSDTTALGRERLRREAVALQRLDHPAVAAILDVELEGADAFIVTDLVDGVSLEDEIAEGGPLDPDDLLALAEQLAEALHAVHSAGVVHRDMKPSNVLVTDDGPVLIDFGIAHGLEDARMTSSGLVMGTPGYLAPELLSGAAPGPGSDWWGWAAMLAYSATGRPPFGIRPVDAVLARARSGDADLAGLGARTYGALSAALNPDPRRRLGPEQVVRALRTAAEEGDPRVEDDAVSPGTVGAATAAVAAGAALTQVVASDGSTVAVPVGGFPEDPAAAAPPVPGEGPPAPPGTEAGAEGGPETYQRRWPPRRPWPLLGLGLAITLYGGAEPAVAVAVLAALVLLSRWFGVMAESLHGRRESRGVSRWDGWRVGALSPVLLVRAVLGALPGLLVGACAGLLVVVGGWWLLAPGRLVLAPDPAVEARAVGGANEEWVFTVVMCVAVGLTVLFGWFGPMSWTTRYGARLALDTVAPGWGGRTVAIVVAFAAALAAAVLVGTGTEIDWWPFAGPPSF